MEKREIMKEIKRWIKEMYRKDIEKVKMKINLYDNWSIEINTKIKRRWWVVNDNGECVNLGEKREEEMEKWMEKDSNYMKWRVDWKLSKNEKIEKIRREIEEYILDNYKDKIGIYYDYENNKQYKLIVEVKEK